MKGNIMSMHTVSGSCTLNTEQNAEQKKRRNTIKFTHLKILHLTNTEQKRKIFWCEGMTGFGVELGKNGSKTWVYQFRIDGIGRRMVLGKFPKVSLSEAIRLYSEAHDKVAHGVDPLEERNAKRKGELKQPSLGQLIKLYTESSRLSGKQSYIEENRVLNKEFSASLKAKKASKIKPQDISAIVQRIMKRGAPSMAVHTLKYIKAMYGYAIEMAIVEYEENPCHGIRLKISKSNRQRHLTPQEIHLFWKNIEKVPMDRIMRLALKFLLCTVCRPIEVRNMKWSDVNLKTGIWTLPTSKNGRLHRVYLGNIAIGILKEAYPFTGDCSLVFSSRDKTRPISKYSLAQPFRRHFEKLEITEKFYPYDFRRTGATMIAGLFGRRDFASMALNHTTSDVTGIYDQYAYDREKKMMLYALDKAIEVIIKCPNVESVPSFEDLREIVISSNQNSASQQNNSKGLPTIKSSPLSYRLSYDHIALTKSI